MEKTNKKNMYKIFLGIFLLQGFALLALSVNSLLAEDTAIPSFTITPSVENIAANPAKKLLKATVSSEYNLTSAMGKIIDSAGYTTSKSPFDLTYQAANIWSYEYDTTNLSDGNYYFCAKGFYNASEITWNCNVAAFSVSNTISTIPNFIITPTVENIAAYPAKKLLKATAFSNLSGQNLTKITGKIKTTSGVLIGSFFNLIKIAGTDFWSYEYNASSLNGNYNFCVIGEYNGVALAEICSSPFTVNNTAFPSLSISFYEDYSVSAISGTKTIYAMTNKDVISVEFRVVSSSGTATSYAGIKYPALNKYYFSWDTSTLTNGTYALKVIANNGTEIADTQRTVAVYNSVTTPIIPTFIINAGIDGINAAGQVISGVKNIWASSASPNSTSVLNNLDFKLKKISDYTYIHIANASSTDYKNWSGNWNSANIADGDYVFFAEGKYIKNDGTYDIYQSNFINVNVKNTATIAPLSISFYEDYSVSAISGTKTIYAAPSSIVDKVDFKIISSTGNSVVFAGVKDASLNKYNFSWNTAIFSNGTHMIKTTAYKGAEVADAQKTVTVYNSASAIPLTAEFVNIPLMSLEGDKKIQIKTSAEPTSVRFEMRGGKYASFSAIKIDSSNYYFLWRTIEFPNGDYLVYAFIEKGDEKIDIHTKTRINNPTTSLTPETPIIITFVEKLASPLSGDQKISISANQEIYNCLFKIEGPKFMEITGLKESSTKCYMMLNASDFPNGDYIIKAIAGKNSSLGENKLTVRIENQISSAMQPVPAETAPAIKLLPVDTTFISQECKDKKILVAEECQKYLLIPYKCRKADISDSAKCMDYIFKQAMSRECLEQNAQTQEECDKIIMLKNMPLECQKQKASSKEECDKIIKLKSLLTSECVNASINNVENCNKYMADNFMPEECRQANVATKEGCDYLLRNKYNNLASLAKSDYSAELEYLPGECKKENAKSEQECKDIMFRKYAPDDCRKVGIINQEACNKYMFDKYNSKENIVQEKLPIECQKAEAKTADDCRRVMKKMYMPKECADNGILDQKECDLYFKQKYMPKECQEKNAGSREECDKIMFKKFGPSECQKAGIEDEKECGKFMSNKYANKITCQGLEQWQCQNTIKERHIGNIVAVQSKFEEVKEKTAELIGKTINLEDLKIESAGEKGISPLKEKNGIKITAAQEKLILDEEENLIQASPIAFMIDSDGDELPDDMERRIGTDPFNKDTDGDGNSDSEEIRSGNNPLGEGNFEKEISPIDKAILQNKIIEHPKTEGEETDSFSIENINNIKNEQNEASEGYLLNGKAEPNSVATLYIYSDLPAVMTVDVDKYGNWRYKLDQSLVEGEHEVYIAINDDTGKVVKKSKPLNFFIREASAVSVKDFVAEAETSSAEFGESEISISNYLIIAIAMAIFGIFLFLAVIISRKKNQPLL